MAEHYELSIIDPNPWQPRQEKDPEHIKKIALSIAQDGLMQVPIGRRVDGRVQLAFGHSRLAAYRWLVDMLPSSNIEGDYTRMPVELRELSDLQMFDLAIRENIARKDLSPIDEARAMLRYRQDFGKTSKEIGELFGISDSAVRNKMRLLELPETVQAQVGGDLSEMTARRLISLQKVAPAQVETVARKLSEGDYKTPSAVDEEIRRTLEKVALRMWCPWDSGDPRGGTGLWPLEWTPEGFLEITKAAFLKLYAGPESVTIRYPDLFDKNLDRPVTYQAAVFYDDLITYLMQERHGHDHSIVQAMIAEAAPEALALLRQLSAPPACTACSHYVKLDGYHYCALQACHKGKKAKWLQSELARCVEELGIPAYVKDDGPSIELVWYRSEDKQRFEERNPNLRLKARYQEYFANSFTKSNCVIVVELPQEENRVKQEKIGEYQTQESTWEKDRQEAIKSEGFIAQAAGMFANALAGIDSLGLLTDLSVAIYGKPEEIPAGRKERLAYLRQYVAFRILLRLVPYNVMKMGPVETAKHLQGIATTWGVQLTEDLALMAGVTEIPPEPDEPIYVDGEEDSGDQRVRRQRGTRGDR
ncbi:MAG TPA: ParB/RepB/Spo0J family partition protein [Levilinea sp.]|nr:ParB/RepB/Spo0J family partition protein [Levilinea sp.]